MARVAVTKTRLPAGNVDGADRAVTLTGGDATNDHVVTEASAGDLICVWATSATANTTSIQAYPNRYGRPTAAAAALSDAGESTAGRMVIYYLAYLDGMVNVTGGCEINISQAYPVFCLAGGG